MQEPGPDSIQGQAALRLQITGGCELLQGKTAPAEEGAHVRPNCICMSLARHVNLWKPKSQV